MWKGESAAGLAVWTQGEPLYNAVDKRRVENVKRLLGQGQDPNDDAMRGHGEEQWTPLHRAAAHGHEEMIDALLRAGAGDEEHGQGREAHNAAGDATHDEGAPPASDAASAGAAQGNAAASSGRMQRRCRR